MVEPVRYRKVVVEMMGNGGLATPASSADTKPHILLTRDQELAISNAVETFEKKCEELRGQREGICEAIKQYRVGRGSELENMRAFIQVCTSVLSSVPKWCSCSRQRLCPCVTFSGFISFQVDGTCNVTEDEGVAMYTSNRNTPSCCTERSLIRSLSSGPWSPGVAARFVALRK